MRTLLYHTAHQTKSPRTEEMVHFLVSLFSPRLPTDQFGTSYLVPCDALRVTLDKENFAPGYPLVLVGCGFI
jgi:hypothetical protein